MLPSLAIEVYKELGVSNVGLLSYALLEDSARIRALLECDKNGKVVLKWFDEEHSKRMNLQSPLDTLANLLITVRRNLILFNCLKRLSMLARRVFLNLLLLCQWKRNCLGGKLHSCGRVVLLGQ